MGGKSRLSTGKTQKRTPKTPGAADAGSPYAGRPLDGSQYHEVIEEQIYSELRPTDAEQRPRYSFLHPPSPKGRKR